MNKALKTGFVFTALLAAVAFAGEKISVSDFLKKVDTYDHKVVTIAGKADNFKAKTSKKGNAYFTFRILGNTEDEKVYVFSQGKLDKELKDGTKVEVTGKFEKEKKVGTLTFKNEIDISKDDRDAKGTKDFGVKIIAE
jgi:hypothetical protein